MIKKEPPIAMGSSHWLLSIFGDKYNDILLANNFFPKIS